MTPEEKAIASDLRRTQELAKSPEQRAAEQAERDERKAIKRKMRDQKDTPDIPSPHVMDIDHQLLKYLKSRDDKQAEKEEMRREFIENAQAGGVNPARVRGVRATHLMIKPLRPNNLDRYDDVIKRHRALQREGATWVYVR